VSLVDALHHPYGSSNHSRDVGGSESPPERIPEPELDARSEMFSDGFVVEPDAGGERFSV
jgi:hypothetical protein